MDAILEILSRGVEQLFGRVGGPLNFRLVVMPTVVTVLAVRAGLRDAREGRVAFLWLSDPTERRKLIRSGIKDIGRVFIVACVLDTAYQIFVLRAFYIVQLLIVAVVCAILPYVLVRGLVTRLASRSHRIQAEPANGSAAKTTSEAESGGKQESAHE